MPGPAAFRNLKQTARHFVTDPRQGLGELPGRAVRAGVIGAGRALLLADRFREEYKEVRREGVGSTVTRLRTDGLAAFGRGPTAQPDVSRPEPESPGTVRSDGPQPAAEPGVAEPASPQPAAEEPAGAPEPAAAQASTPPAAEQPPAAADLPVPNYDELSLASLRARLRNLTVEQVRRLRDYEKAHTNRESVVTMYDNRIAKLTGERPGG